MKTPKKRKIDPSARWHRCDSQQHLHKSIGNKSAIIVIDPGEDTTCYAEVVDYNYKVIGSQECESLQQAKEFCNAILAD
jgi:hypothetical protein